MIQSLQLLRAVAALLVVGYHVREGVALPEDSRLLALFSVGASGVNLFFLISGFIMCYTTEERSDPWRFIGRRIVRIVPLYWLLLLFHTGVHSLTNPQTLLSMAFIPLSTSAPPFLGYATWTVGWTLNYEMFFYLVFFAALFVRGSRKVRNGLIFGFFALLHLLFMVLSGTSFLASFDPYTRIGGVSSAYLSMMLNPMMLLFCVGILVAWVYKRFRNAPVGCNLAALFLSAVGMVVFFTAMEFDGHGVKSSFFCLMLFVAALSTERFIKGSKRLTQALRPLVYLGTISYSIYMLHMLFLVRFHVNEFPLPEWSKVVLIFALTILASAISYEWIEKRLSGKLKRLLHL